MNLMLHSKVVYWRSGRGRVDHVQLMRLQTGRTPTSDVMVHTHACWTACRGAPVVEYFSWSVASSFALYRGHISNSDGGCFVTDTQKRMALASMLARNASRLA